MSNKQIVKAVLAFCGMLMLAGSLVNDNVIFGFGLLMPAFIIFPLMHSEGRLFE